MQEMYFRNAHVRCDYINQDKIGSRPERQDVQSAVVMLLRAFGVCDHLSKFCGWYLNYTELKENQ